MTPILMEPELSEAIPTQFLVGRGLSFQLAPDGHRSRTQKARQYRDWDDLYAQLKDHGLTQKWTGAFLLWHHFNAATIYLRQGDIQAAAQETGYAAKLNPTSPQIHALRQAIEQVKNTPETERPPLLQQLRARGAGQWFDNLSQ